MRRDSHYHGLPPRRLGQDHEIRGTNRPTQAEVNRDHNDHSAYSATFNFIFAVGLIMSHAILLR